MAVEAVSPQGGVPRPAAGVTEPEGLESRRPLDASSDMWVALALLVIGSGTRPARPRTLTYMSMTAATMSVPSRQCRQSASFAAGNWHRLRSGAR